MSRSIYLLLLTSLVLIQCKPEPQITKNRGKQFQLSKELGELLSNQSLKGSINILDLSKGLIYTNDTLDYRQGHLPASTFKIPHTLIALETKTIASKEEVIPWDGRKRSFNSWNQDLSFKKAFQYSCLPCYQQIAPRIGLRAMKSNLDKIGYPGMKFDAGNLDIFWLDGQSRISPKEQIHFIHQIINRSLPIMAKHYDLLAEFMELKSTDTYQLYGKTGWSFHEQTTLNNGWFVGYLKTNNSTYIFATNVSPLKDFDMADFPAVRKSVTMEAFKLLRLL